MQEQSHFLGQAEVEPYERILRVLFGDVSPQEAAECVKPLAAHVWEKPIAIPESAPDVLQGFWNEIAWRRFAADNGVSLQLACAHFLYRAAASLGDPADADASLILMSNARRILRDVLLTWLGARDCHHCIKLRDELQRGQP